MNLEIKSIIKESIRTKQELLKNGEVLFEIEKAINLIAAAFRKNKKIVIFGNGGSAADAQHFAAELVNKFRIERKPLPAVSLVTDTSVLSSIANDIGFDYVFSKQIEALGKQGDIAFAITTSDVETKKAGHSTNIANGLLMAKRKKMTTIGLVSDKSKEVLKLLDVAINMPSENTPRIQEGHILIIHIICQLIEKGYEKND